MPANFKVETILLTKLQFAIAVRHVDCYADGPNRAVPGLEEENDPDLDFNYEDRKNPIMKCYKAAAKRGFPAFVVQNGGWCGSSSSILATYAKYGTTTSCVGGEGGPYANDVYLILDVV